MKCIVRICPTFADATLRIYKYLTLLPESVMNFIYDLEGAEVGRKKITEKYAVR